MKHKKEEIDQLLHHLFRHEYGKMVAVLSKFFGIGNLELAEDVVQEALLEATLQWPHSGIPDNPSGWLYKVSKNKALNLLKREKSLKFHGLALIKSQQEELQSVDLSPELILDRLFSQQEIQDEQLKMIFVCCHPGLTIDSQVVLILKTLCGLSLKEIAKAYLSPEENIHKRLVRARQKLRKEKVSLALPADSQLEERLSAVLKVIYLLFNEGYSASSGKELIRFELCEEAIRLAYIISTHKAIKEKSEVYALLALMELNASRFAARLDLEGNMLTLEEQDRSLWNQGLIQKGIINLESSTITNQVSPYQILATISAHHCIAVDIHSTDWKSILTLYDNLYPFDQSPLVLLNRAIALSKVSGPLEGLQELEQLKESPALKNYPLFFSTMAQLYFESNMFPEANTYFQKAITLSPLAAEKKLLRKRLDLCQEKILNT